jgi:hypothetical protein
MPIPIKARHAVLIVLALTALISVSATAAVNGVLGDAGPRRVAGEPGRSAPIAICRRPLIEATAARVHDAWLKQSRHACTN